ncbi:MAG: type II toxin-antitoxin system VapC family toxin [Thermofilaceae archaeon]
MYLFDSSSIVNLVKKGVLKPLAAGATINLAVYESVNAVWKEHRLLGKIDGRIAAEWIALLAEIFNTIPVYSLSELGEMDRVLTGIFSLAVSEGITVYDASYIYAAETMGLVLVTDDSRLRSAAEKHVKTLTSAQLIV